MKKITAPSEPSVPGPAKSPPETRLQPSTGLVQEASAGDFLKHLAEELQFWLDKQTSAGKDKNMHAELKALLPNGPPIIVQRMSAHGGSMIKVAGFLPNGNPCLLLSHQNSMQFLAVVAPNGRKKEVTREMGFHTLIIGDSKIEASAAAD